MKVWVKFNAGFQLCPPDFNFSPRSREAGDAPAAGTLEIFATFFCQIMVKTKKNHNFSLGPPAGTASCYGKSGPD